MSLFVVELDGAPAAHLLRALENHARWCRANGVTVPLELDALAAAAARSGQERPVRDGLDDLGDGLLVPFAYTYHGAGVLLGVSERTVRRLVSTGELCAMEVGGSRRIHRDDLDDYATRKRAEAEAQA